MHRRLVWGVALGLLLAHVVRFVRRDATQLRALAWAPWTAMRLATPRVLALTLAVCCALIFAVNYPLLLSCVTVAVLALLWRRQTRQMLPTPEPQPHDEEVTDEA